MTQSELDDSGNNPRAEALIQDFRSFIQKLEERSGSHAGDVIHNGTVLDGETIGQAPERFVEEYLIRPMAVSLGYDYRPQPKGIAGIDKEIPDFGITNAPGMVIGEIKTPNRIDNGRQEAFEYLRKTTATPAVGISTDGLTWILHSGGSGERHPEYTYHRSFRKKLRTLRTEQKFDSGIESLHAFREKIALFADEFAIENLNHILHDQGSK